VENEERKDKEKREGEEGEGEGRRRVAEERGVERISIKRA